MFNLSALLAVDDDVGKALYGEEYKSHTYFVAKHLRAAADKACDHWHDSTSRTAKSQSHLNGVYAQMLEYTRIIWRSRSSLRRYCKLLILQ
jgi:hypothetical protein